LPVIDHFLKVEDASVEKASEKANDSSHHHEKRTSDNSNAVSYGLILGENEAGTTKEADDGSQSNEDDQSHKREYKH
jgi:hypothetical protein